MKLTHVKNINKFFETVNECKGSVYMDLPGGKVNLKENEDIYCNLMKGIAPSVGYTLDLRTEYPEETMKFVKFAMRA